MLYLTYEQDGHIRRIDYDSSKVPTREKASNGFEIESLPTNEHPDKIAILKVDTTTLNQNPPRLYYEYEDIPPKPENILDSMQRQTAQILLALVNNGLI